MAERQRPQAVPGATAPRSFQVVLVAATAFVIAACGQPPGTASSPSGSPADRSEGPPPQTTVVFVSGILDPSGDRLLVLNPPVRRVTTGEVRPQPGGRYRLEVQYETGERVELPFDGLVSDDAGNTVHGFFEVAVPEVDPISTMSIHDTRAGRVLATLQGADIVD